MGQVDTVNVPVMERVLMRKYCIIRQLDFTNGTMSPANSIGVFKALEAIRNYSG